MSSGPPKSLPAGPGVPGVPKAVPAAPKPGALPGAPGAPGKPGGLPGAPTGLPGKPAGAAPAAPSSLPSAPGGKPAGLPGAPTGLPGAPKALPKGAGSLPTAPGAPKALPGGPGAGRPTAPPAPKSLPSLRAGPSDTGFSAPPAPNQLPAAPPKPAAVPGAPKPGGLPGGYPAAPKPGVLPGAGVVPPAPKALPAAKVEEVEPEEPLSEEDELGGGEGQNWRQYIEADADDGIDDDDEPSDVGDEEEEEDSGEDSDAEPAASADEERRKRDMELLKARQETPGQYARAQMNEAKSAAAKPKPETFADAVTDEEEASPPHKSAGSDNEEVREDSSAAFLSQAPSSKKRSLISRVFSKSTKGQASPSLSGTSLLKANIDSHDESWYAAHLSRLEREGLPCTKIGTNGKPYDRRVHIDARNMQVEIRGGRTGATGVVLDDLVDLRKGFGSSEFEQFVVRIRKDCEPSDLHERALVLQMPHRTFSLLFSSGPACTTMAHSILYLLRSKNRGVMSSAPQVTSTSKGPKNGHATVHYPNRSSYSGQFQNYLRHGQGTMTLSDGTIHESEWRYDERHGKGKETCPDNTVFVGSYNKGLRHGFGVMTWPEGSRYADSLSVEERMVKANCFELMVPFTRDASQRTACPARAK
uniref:Dinap1-interacting protein 5 n=2 Tax=Crypthecodinium cohnii TaxID=2866 RepID=Q9LD34_CRYCO|nr:Dinap1-interacting protein 5 [Crypthecodinium cohnii]